MKRLVLAAAALSLALAAAPASADTATGTVNVTAQVTNACVVNTPSLNLGTYDLNVTSTPATTNIVVKCTTGTAYTLVMGPERTLNGPGSEQLTFQLSDTAGGTTFPATIGGTGNGNNQSIPIYGQIPAGQYASAGTYSGSVSFAVNY